MHRTQRCIIAHHSSRSRVSRGDRVSFLLLNRLLVLMLLVPDPAATVLAVPAVGTLCQSRQRCYSKASVALCVSRGLKTTQQFS